MGGGKVGEYLASVLLGKGHEVAVLESDRDTADHLSVELQGEYLIINGDGCDSDFQEDAGIRKADVFVAVTGRDDDNLVACEIATRVFNVNLRHFKMDDGVPVDVIDLPEGSLLIAVDRREYGEAEVATDDMVLYPGDKAVVVAEHDIVDDVRAVFGAL